MRTDATFIGIEVADDAASDPALAAKLQETCPVDIYAERTATRRTRRSQHRRMHPLRHVRHQPHPPVPSRSIACTRE